MLHVAGVYGRRFYRLGWRDWLISVVVVVVVVGISLFYTEYIVLVSVGSARVLCVGRHGVYRDLPIITLKYACTSFFHFLFPLPSFSFLFFCFLFAVMSTVLSCTILSCTVPSRTVLSPPVPSPLLIQKSTRHHALPLFPAPRTPACLLAPVLTDMTPYPCEFKSRSCMF